jgi:hypothetical protein
VLQEGSRCTAPDRCAFEGAAQRPLTRIPFSPSFSSSHLAEDENEHDDEDDSEGAT